MGRFCGQIANQVEIPPTSRRHARGQLHLRFVDHFIGQRVLLRILAGFIRHLLSVFQLLLGRAHVDLFQLDGVLRQNPQIQSIDTRCSLPHHSSP